MKAELTEKIMHCNNLSLERKTSATQKDPDKLIAKLLFCVIHVRPVQEKQKYELVLIIAMDDISVWSDMLSATMLDATSKKESLWRPQAMKSPTFQSA